MKVFYVAFLTCNLLCLVGFCSGSMLEAWQGYIAMQIEFDNINEARSIYRRCYSKRFPGMGSEVCILLLFFMKSPLA